MNPRLPALRGIWLMARMRCLRQRNFLQHTLLRGEQRFTGEPAEHLRRHARLTETAERAPEVVLGPERRDPEDRRGRG